jgi:hypothetical protein
VAGVEAVGLAIGDWDTELLGVTIGGLVADGEGAFLMGVLDAVADGWPVGETSALGLMEVVVGNGEAATLATNGGLTELLELLLPLELFNKSAVANVPPRIVVAIAQKLISHGGKPWIGLREWSIAVYAVCRETTSFWLHAVLSLTAAARSPLAGEWPKLQTPLKNPHSGLVES